MCNSENHQRLSNEAIPHNNLIYLFPLPMYVRSAKFMERLKGDQAIHQIDEKLEFLSANHLPRTYGSFHI